MAKFFTKKVCLIALAVVIALGGIIWAVVANYTPKFRSKITAIPAGYYVSGNGTASVMVDNYLYFVGDSVATSSIKYGDNEYYPDGTIPDAGIFRVKIGEDSVPVLDYEYDNTYTNEDTGEKAEWQEGDADYNTVVVGVNDWDNIGKKNNGIEAVVPKIAGHDKTAMWVFGKYLIYTSPHNRYDNRGNLMSDYLDFFRVDLNGKHHTLIYTTDSTDLTTKNFTVWADATDNIYLLVYETDNEEDDPTPSVKKINVKTKKITILDSDVSNVVLPTATQYKTESLNESLAQVYGGVMSYVYYTKDRTTINENSTLKGNLLYRCSINDGEPELIADSGTAEKGTTFTPLAVTPLNVDGAVASAQFVFSTALSDSNSTPYPKYLCAITNKNMDTFTYTGAEIDTDVNVDGKTIEIYANGFCTIDSALYHYDIVGSHIIFDKSNGEAKKLLSSLDSVLAVMGDTIYVQASNSVSMINKNGSATTISIVTSTSTDSSDDETTDDTSSETTTDDESTDETTLPVAILYLPQGNTGNPMIFVQDSSYIRLFYTDKTYNYLRFKES